MIGWTGKERVASDGRLVEIAPAAEGMAELPAALRELLCFRAASGHFFLPEVELAELRDAGMPFQVVSTRSEQELPVHFTHMASGALDDPPPRSARLAVLCRLLAQGLGPGALEVQFLGRHREVPSDGFVLDRLRGRRRYVWRTREASPSESPQTLCERFPALRAYLDQPDARVVLSLGSGGLKLFSHVAALRFLERIDRADAVDEIWGCSAGALIALLYSYGLSPEAIEQTGYDLYGGRYRLPLRPSRFQVFSGIAREILGWSQTLGGAGFVDCARGIARMIEHYCQNIRPVRPFYCLAYNLEQGRTEVLTPEPVPQHLQELVTHTDAREAVLASSAVPLFFVPRRIEHPGGTVAHYIDGSTTEDVPLYSIVRKWDLDRQSGAESRTRLIILAVKLSPRIGSARLAPDGRVGKLRLLQTVAAAGVETIHSRDLALIAGRPDIELFTLQLASSGDDFFETGRIPDYIQAAKEDFPEQLAKLERQLMRRAPPGPVRSVRVL